MYVILYHFAYIKILEKIVIAFKTRQIIVKRYEIY